MSAPAAASPADGGSALAVFRNRPFLLLWLSQLATQVGGNMVLFGLTILVYDLTGSATIVSFLLLTYLTPAVIFSALAGVYVDRFDRRTVLVVANLVRFGLFLALAFFDTNVLLILVLNIAVSIASTFFAPAELSMIPIVVPRSQLTAANGIFVLTLQAAFAIGFALVGPLVVKVAGPTVLILIVAALYLVAAGFCWTLPKAPPGKAAHDGAVAEAEAAMGSVVAQLREGIAYVRANRVVSWALLYLGIAASIIGVLGVLGPGFAEDVLGLEPEDFVVIVLPLGVGVVIGALTVNAVQGIFPRRRVIEAGLLVLGVCLVLLTASSSIVQVLGDVNEAVPGPDLSSFVSVLTVVIAIAVVAGVSYAAIAIPAQTELQSEIPEPVRGRVFGILNMLVSVGSFLPIIIVGPIADLVGTMPVVLVSALIILAVGILSVARRRDHAPAADSAAGDGATDVGAPAEVAADVAALAARDEPGAAYGGAGIPGPAPDEP